MQTTKSWLSVIFSAAIIGTLLRCVFFILLAPKSLLQLAPQTPYAEIIHAFVLGLRFDLSAVCYLTLLFWILSIVLSKPVSLAIWKFLLTFWSFLLIVDIGYFSFYNDRINVLVFGLIEDDTWALVKTFWKNYPVVGILAATFVLYHFYSWKIKKNFPTASNRISSVGTRLLVLILLVVGARGSFSLFPLGDHDTVVSSTPFLNTLSYGTAHAFSRAIKLKQEQLKMGSAAWNSNMKEFGYLDHEDQAFEDYFQKKITASENRYALMHSSTTLNLKQLAPPHVVLVVMESWGTYGLQFQSPQFDLAGNMKKYFQNDFINLQFLSTTPATTGSLSCLLSGLPQRTISPFLTEGDYLQTPFSTAPAAVYKKYGYETHFIYGGNPGWRDMNKFALAQGFNYAEGEVDIEKKLIEKNKQLSGKHDWGVFDEDVFKFAEFILQEATAPQLLVIMTTTNHPPFELPKSAVAYNLNIDAFPEKNLLIDRDLALKRFSTFRYSSDSLASFLDAIKSNSKLADKTVIAATADHTFWIKNFSNDEVFMKSSVPFFISLPKDLRDQVSSQQIQNFKSSFAGHQDIWPTLYNVSLSTTSFDSFGRSLWSSPETSFAATFDRLIFTKDRGALVSSAKEFSSLDPSGTLRYLPTEQKTDLDQQLAQKYRAMMAALDSFMHHSKMTP